MPNKFTLIVAYSNGKVRLIDYTPGPSSGTGRFAPRLEIVYGTFLLDTGSLLPTPLSRRGHGVGRGYDRLSPRRLSQDQ